MVPTSSTDPDSTSESLSTRMRCHQRVLVSTPGWVTTRIGRLIDRSNRSRDSEPARSASGASAPWGSSGCSAWSYRACRACTSEPCASGPSSTWQITSRPDRRPDREGRPPEEENSSIVCISPSLCGADAGCGSRRNRRHGTPRVQSSTFPKLAYELTGISPVPLDPPLCSIS